MERRQKKKLIVAIVLCKKLLQSVMYDSSSEEDDEIEYNMVHFKRLQSRDWYRKPVRITLYVEEVVANYNEQEFQRHFRINRTSFDTLLRILSPQLENRSETGRPTINVQKQLLASLWLLATPDSYRSVGERFDMSKSSLFVSFYRVIKALNRVARHIIKWPTGPRINTVKNKFQRMAGLHDVLGAIDGTYVPIKAPQEDPQSYITRKCNFAITLQAICDSERYFTDCFVGFPGSVSDTRIFANSPIKRLITQGRDEYFPDNEFIVGDKAYPNLIWCITPYINRGNLTAAQRQFNLVLSQTRQVIERTFALLFGRFRRLKYLDMNRTDLVPATVLASCVLHNICLDSDDELLLQYEEEGREFVQCNEEYEPPHQVMNLRNDENGHDRRNTICRNMCNRR